MTVGEGGKENGLDNKALASNELIMVRLPPQNITKLMFQEFSLSTAFRPDERLKLKKAVCNISTQAICSLTTSLTGIRVSLPCQGDPRVHQKLTSSLLLVPNTWAVNDGQGGVGLRSGRGGR